MWKFKQSAFTIVELLITIVVMAILLGLGTVAISGLQAQARDKERAQDVAAIARGLEETYKRGNPVVTSTAPENMIQRGAYPGVREMNHSAGNYPVNGAGNIIFPAYTPSQTTESYRTRLLPGTTVESLKPPSSDGYLGVVCAYSWGTNCNGRDTAKIREAFGNPGGTGTYRDAYIYEPLGANNRVCGDRAPYDATYLPNSPCVKFNLYWISETDPTPYLSIPGLKVVKSRHQ